MLEFVKKLMEHRIEQIYKFETTKKKETNTSKNVDFNVSTGYQEVLHLATEINLMCTESIGKISKKLKKMINLMEVKMNKLFENFEIASTEIKFDDIVTLATAYYNLGRVYIYKIVNLDIAKKHFMKCMQLFQGRELNYKLILIAIQTYIDLSVVWMKLNKLDNCSPLLDKALELYLNYTKEEDDYPEPFVIDAFVNNEYDNINTKIFLVKCHIATLRCMEDLYRLRPANMHKFVIYVHNLLNKQLKTINSIENDMFIHWAEASATLSLYFLYHDRFMEAKIHLAAAEYMIAMHYILITTDSDCLKLYENIYKTAHTFTTKLWGIYGIVLLHSSKERLLQCESNKSCETDNIKTEPHPKSEEELMKPLIFVDLEKNLEKIPKYHVTDTYVSNFDDVKIIFVNVLRSLNAAYVYYSASNLFMCQVQAILYMSKAYKYYAYFEGDASKRMKVIKQQINMLKSFITILFSKYNTLEERRYYKILQFELAITYSTLLDITTEEFETVEEITNETRMEYKKLMTDIVQTFVLSTDIF